MTSSPYIYKEMQNSVELTMNDGCTSYDLYISSTLRRSANIQGTLGNISKDKISIEVNPLRMMYDENREKYIELMNHFKSIAKDPKEKKIFMGVSNSCAVFIAAGQIILDTVNNHLDAYTAGAKVERIVLTDEIKEKDSPKVYPLRSSGKFRHMPNWDGPPGAEWNIYEKHLAVYDPLKPTQKWYPTEIKTVVNVSQSLVEEAINAVKAKESLC